MINSQILSVTEETMIQLFPLSFDNNSAVMDHKTLKMCTRLFKQSKRKTA